MDDQNKNLILAMVLSTLVLVVWMVLFAPPPIEETGQLAPDGTTQVDSVPTAPGVEPSGSPESTVAAAPEAPRLPIETPSLSGSISLAGGRIDQLLLKDYHVAVDSEQDVTLLSEIGSTNPYYSVFGWVPGGELATEDVPATDTLWTVESG
ncbi:MAG: membrane protein insertase YidC, partial [Pseudomonadota bacterium]